MSEEKKTELGLDENLEALFCYSLGWVSAIVFLLVEKDNKNIKFHAIQSLILFGAYSLLSFIPILGWAIAGILSPIIFILWIVLMINAYKGKRFKLPVIGDYAAKQVK